MRQQAIKDEFIHLAIPSGLNFLEFAGVREERREDLMDPGIEDQSSTDGNGIPTADVQ